MYSSTVALVKKDSRYEGVRNCLDLLFEAEGLPDIRGKNVMIKPNLVSPLCQSASTHVEAVKAVLDLLIKQSPREITIADGSALGNTEDAFANLKYNSELTQYDVKFRDLNKDDFIKIKLLGLRGDVLEAKLSKTAFESDFRISLALPKTHNFAILTLSSKNMMGCLVENDKRKIHGVTEWTDSLNKSIKENWVGKDYEMSIRVIHKNILTLLKQIPPQLSIIDGFTAMDCDGPYNGKDINLGAFIASYDFLAADAIGASVMGFNPLDIGYIYYAYQEAMGEADPMRIKIIGDTIENVRVSFRSHSLYEAQMKWR